MAVHGKGSEFMAVIARKASDLSDRERGMANRRRGGAVEAGYDKFNRQQGASGQSSGTPPRTEGYVCFGSVPASARPRCYRPWKPGRAEMEWPVKVKH